MMQPSSGQTFLTWALAIFLSLAFLFAGGTKLAGLEDHVQSFEQWGYPLWFLYLTGTLEVGAAILLLIPACRWFGAALIIAIMIGAFFTHLRAQEWAALVMPLIPLVLAGILAWLTCPPWLCACGTGGGAGRGADDGGG